MAIDRFGRRIHYLRISLTDHCNLRCLYCVTRAATFRSNSELMQDEELLRLTRLFADLGFDKIRLTGGEPTLRVHVVDLVQAIAGMPGIQAVSMTTNGMLLSDLAGSLAAAGLQRVNISIDTLDPVKFKRLTCIGNIQAVWNGILAAEKAGLLPIKLNVVVVRGYNEDDVVELARLTLDHPWQVRFIEMMPFGGNAGFQTEKLVPAADTFQRIEQALGPLTSVSNGGLDGETQVFRLRGARSTIGFIHSITAPFCESCNKVRLTADGVLRLCLLRDYEVDLLTPLREGASLVELKKLVLDSVWNKPWGQGLAEGVIPLKRTLNEIGG
jgi:cyclic pyranopterin phosphate synthase